MLRHARKIRERREKEGQGINYVYEIICAVSSVNPMELLAPDIQIKREPENSGLNAVGADPLGTLATQAETDAQAASAKKRISEMLFSISQSATPATYAQTKGNQLKAVSDAKRLQDMKAKIEAGDDDSDDWGAMQLNPNKRKAVSALNEMTEISDRIYRRGGTAFLAHNGTVNDLAAVRSLLDEHELAASALISIMGFPGYSWVIWDEIDNEYVLGPSLQKLVHEEYYREIKLPRFGSFVVPFRSATECLPECLAAYEMISKAHITGHREGMDYSSNLRGVGGNPIAMGVGQLVQRWRDSSATFHGEAKVRELPLFKQIHNKDHRYFDSALFEAMIHDGDEYKTLSSLAPPETMNQDHGDLPVALTARRGIYSSERRLKRGINNKVRSTASPNSVARHLSTVCVGVDYAYKFGINTTLDAARLMSDKGQESYTAEEHAKLLQWAKDVAIDYGYFNIKEDVDAADLLLNEDFRRQVNAQYEELYDDKDEQ